MFQTSSFFYRVCSIDNWLWMDFCGEKNTKNQNDKKEINLLVPLLLRPSVFPGGDNIGLDADDDDACWRCAPKWPGVWCKCDWCNECNFVWDADGGAIDEIDALPKPDANKCGAWWCNWWISERLVKETPSSGWLLCTITLLLVACVWCDVEDGWPPEISIIFLIHNSQ